MSLHVLKCLRARNSPMVELRRSEALLVHVGWKLYYRNIFLSIRCRHTVDLIFWYININWFERFTICTFSFRYTNILLLGCSLSKHSVICIFLFATCARCVKFPISILLKILLKHCKQFFLFAKYRVIGQRN